MSTEPSARDVLRTAWAAGGDLSDQLGTVDADCSPTKNCRNMQGITFDGYAEPGTDLRAAWRDRLAREGKLSTDGGTIRDLVLGPRQ